MCYITKIYILNKTFYIVIKKKTSNDDLSTYKAFHVSSFFILTKCFGTELHIYRMKLQDLQSLQVCDR